MSNHPTHTRTYRIKSVANTTGLSTHVIRKWEECYQLLHPQRGPNGYRLFTDDGIQLRRYVMKSQPDNGKSIGQLARTGEDGLRHPMQHVPMNLSGIPRIARNDIQEPIRVARRQAMNATTAMRDNRIGRLGFERTLDIMIFPLLRLIGELWHQGGISLRGNKT